MKCTIPLTENHLFRRLYHQGKSKVSPWVAVYWRKNRLSQNRLGITTSKKLGGAVQRNRARRVIKEAYRLLEPELKPGFDIVVVARQRAVTAKMQQVKKSLSGLLEFARREV